MKMTLKAENSDGTLFKLADQIEARFEQGRHVVKRMFKGGTVRYGAEAGGNLYGVRREDT